MSRDEILATLIQDTLRETLERRSEDPGAVDRVGVAVGAALGQGPEDEDHDRSPEGTRGRPSDPPEHDDERPADNR